MDCTINYAVTFCAVERLSTMWLTQQRESFNASYSEAWEVFPNELKQINGHSVSDHFYKGGTCLCALAASNT